MTKVVLSDAQVITALDAIQDVSQLCDSQGRVLGFYLPDAARDQVFFRGIKSPYPREELERVAREEANDAKPLAEFWADMKVKYSDQFQ